MPLATARVEVEWRRRDELAPERVETEARDPVVQTREEPPLQSRLERAAVVLERIADSLEGLRLEIERIADQNADSVLGLADAAERLSLSPPDTAEP